MAIRLVSLDQMHTALSHLKVEMETIIAEQAMGEFVYDNVEAGLHNAFCHLWLYWDDGGVRAWAVTRFGDYARKRRLVIDLMGGMNMNVWLDEGLAALESWGKSHGAVEVECRVRPGLAKALAKRGFVDAYRLVLKEIPQGVH